MDIYGHGQSIGALVTCYCRKNNIDIDELMNGILQEKSIFVSGISDGVGGNREIGVSTNNWILENMKVKETSQPTTEFKVGDIVFVRNNDDTEYKETYGVYREHQQFFGRIIEIDDQQDDDIPIGVMFDAFTTWYYNPKELGYASELNNMTIKEVSDKYGIRIQGTYYK